MPKPICFVIQEFDDGGFFDTVYDLIIEPAVKEAGFICQRADKMLGARPPLKKIEEALTKASLCIAEATNNNPNVFLEIGWAMGLQKPFFILWDKYQRPKGLPFDVSHSAGIPYDSLQKGWQKQLKERLVENLKFEFIRLSENHQIEDLTIADLLNKFLTYSRKYHSLRSFEYYKGHIDNFVKHIGSNANAPASSLKTSHVTDWLDNQKDWSHNYTRGAIATMQAAYNWAVKHKRIAENPIKGLTKPIAKQRDNLVTPSDFEKMLSLSDVNDSFYDLLIFVWNTDCRPEEMRYLEAKHIDLKNKLIHMPQGGARTRQKSRTIPLRSEVIDIVTKLADRYPEGKLFRNSRREAWTKFAICNRFNRCSKEIGKNYTASDCRNGAARNAKRSMAA